MMDLKQSEAEQLRRVAFVGVVLSTVATLSAVLTVPTLYNHMQYVHAEMEREVEYCKVSMDGMHTPYPLSSHTPAQCVVNLAEHK